MLFRSKNVLKEGRNYCLLYSDGTVVDKLKETDDHFILHKYKAECGKPYSRIWLYLCLQLDYSQGTLVDCLSNDISDTELENLIENTSCSAGNKSSLVDTSADLGSTHQATSSWTANSGTSGLFTPGS